MPQSPTTGKKTTKQPVKSPALLLTTTALDTTWRFFVPLLAGLFIGIWLDGLWQMTPIVTSILVLLGAVSAGWLVYKQLKAVK